MILGDFNEDTVFDNDPFMMDEGKLLDTPMAHETRNNNNPNAIFEAATTRTDNQVIDFDFGMPDLGNELTGITTEQPQQPQEQTQFYGTPQQQQQQAFIMQMSRQQQAFPKLQVPTSDPMYAPRDRLSPPSVPDLAMYEPTRKRRKVKEERDYTMMMDRSSGSPPHIDVMPPKKKQPAASTTKSTKKKSHKRSREEIVRDRERLSYLIALPNPTDAEKEERKRLRNRETAKNSRDKKKRQVRELQHTICDLQAENHTLTTKLAQVSAELETYKTVVATCRTCSASVSNKRSSVFGRGTFIMCCVLFCFTLGIFFVNSNFGSSSSQQHQQQLTLSGSRNQRSLLSTNTEISREMTVVPPQQPQQQSEPAVQRLTTATSSGAGVLVDNQLDTRFLPTRLIVEGLEKDRVLIPEIMKAHFAQNTSSAPPLEPERRGRSSSPPVVVSKKYQEAVIYRSSSEGGSRPEAVLFCPFVYPLLPSPTAPAMPTAKREINILYPIEVIRNDTKLYRLGSLKAVTTEEPTMSDSYLSFEELQTMMPYVRDGNKPVIGKTVVATQPPQEVVSDMPPPDRCSPTEINIDECG